MIMTSHSATSEKKKWLKLTLLCPPILLEAVIDLMGVLSGSGVEQSLQTEHGSTVSGFFHLESSQENAGALAAEVKQTTARVKQQLQELFSIYELNLDGVQSELLDDEDWATSWQQYFTPMEIIPGLVIKPSWEDYRPQPGQKIIEMDPGMAFGTGQHASTRMALSLISDAFDQAQLETVLDVGTGTGILAMTAALFGAKNVIAIDNDPDAVAAASENCRHNNLSSQIEVSGTELDSITGTFQLVCANIIHDVLVAMAPKIQQLSAANGYVVLAGILTGGQEENIKTVYRQQGMVHLKSEHQDEWAALLFHHEEHEE